MPTVAIYVLKIKHSYNIMMFSVNGENCNITRLVTLSFRLEVGINLGSLLYLNSFHTTETFLSSKAF